MKPREPLLATHGGRKNTYYLRAAKCHRCGNAISLQRFTRRVAAECIVATALHKLTLMSLPPAVDRSAFEEGSDDDDDDSVRCVCVNGQMGSLHVALFPPLLVRPSSFRARFLHDVAVYTFLPTGHKIVLLLLPNHVLEFARAAAECI